MKKLHPRRLPKRSLNGLSRGGRKQRSWWGGLLALVLAAGCLSLAGCGRSLHRADLVFINGAEPESLDPALITGQPEGRIVNALFEGLTTYGPDGKPQPGVAERWEISPDGLTYTFFFRSNARWSNGDPVTAADFVGSWKRTLTPATGSDYASQLYFVRNAQPFHEGKLDDFSQVGVRAIDARTLEVRLENPTAFFLDLCAFVTLFPVHLPSVEAFGDDWTKPEHLIGNGAYVLREWKINDRIRLEKNPHYWNRSTVAMKSVDCLPISNANTAFNFYSNGQADLMLDKGLVPNQLLDELKNRADFHSAPFLGTYFVRFNCTRPPFDDPRVRKAFSLVIDKPLIVEKITRAGEPVADSIVPPGAGGYEPPPGPKRDVEQARELLAQAGFPGGEDFPRVSYLYSEGSANEAIAVELQAMFARDLGIRVDLHRQEWKVYLSSMSRMDYDFCRSTWVGDYNDPNTFLNLFVTGDGNNRTGWGDPRYDRLIADAAREADPQARLAIFREAEQLLITEEAPICPLYFIVGIQFFDASRLGGIEPNMIDEHPIKAMYWKKKR
ncbi:MAG TPA: peptide ABC transporter substrate-binding protein [Chthoniobacteraceae bacterium]|nr:peptide ABC transporter substrate-binding protein [Chthoniobacteraceae bacterium]